MSKKKELSEHPHQLGGFYPRKGKKDFKTQSVKKKFLFEGDKLFKPVMSHTKEEYTFYENESEIYKNVIPQYFGRKTIEEQEYMVLKNLTKNFEKPCVVDLKMGTKTYGPDTKKEKIEYEKKKYPPQAVIGFRFTGMKVFNGATDQYEKFDKHWGRKITEKSVDEAVKKYFASSNKKIKENMVKDLKEILKVMEKKRHHFCAVSILLIYEGKGGKSDEIVAKLIDFDHWYSAEKHPKHEDGVVYGIKNLIKIIEKLI